MNHAAKLVAQVLALAVTQAVRNRQSRISLEEQAPWLFENRRGRRRRKPPEAGMPVPAIVPKGPLPKQGGAQAPLDFRAD